MYMYMYIYMYMHINIYIHSTPRKIEANITKSERFHSSIFLGISFKERAIAIHRLAQWHQARSIWAFTSSAPGRSQKGGC